MKLKNIKNLPAIVFGVLVLCFAIGFYLFAWTGPSEDPPGGNVDAPINVGSTAQTKTGSLTVGGLTISDAQDCDTINTDGSGTVSCGTDAVDDAIASCTNVNSCTITAEEVVCSGCVGSSDVSALDTSDVTSGRFGVARLPALTDEKIWKGTGGNVEEIDVPTGIPDSLAGDILRSYDDSEKCHIGTTYTKKKAIKILQTGTIRVKFDLMMLQAGYTAYGRIYRNDVAVGTVQSTTGQSYTTKSEDISGWTAGDELELYLKVSATIVSACSQNLRVYTD